MTLKELDVWFKSFLKPELYPQDPSRNGIQIQNSDPDNKQIKKVAVAVDACYETAIKAAKQGADVLFVHHGLFWGGCEPIVGTTYNRYQAFLKNDLALYAMHIPLDANNPYGNNYGLANRIGLTNLQEFGQWRGMTLGVMGELSKECTVSELAQKVLNPNETPLKILNFGKEKIKTVGIISGGAADDVYQAIEQGLDVYITGEVNHELFHYVKESKMNLIAGGHYQTETVGINLVRQKIEKELGLETVFIDVPTSL